MYGYIYKHTSPSGKSYIGQTTRRLPEIRWKKGREYSTSPLILKAIEKYGWDNFTHEVLETVEANTKRELVQKLNKFEEYYIFKLNTLVPNGYNLKTGGENHLVSEEVREKISKNNSKYWLGKSRPDISGKVSKALTGRKLEEGQRKTISSSTSKRNIGRHWYTNGGKNVFCYGCPEGYWPGSNQKLRNKKTSNEELSRIHSNSLLGRKWFNNGIISTLTYSCSEGFKPGRISWGTK